MEQWILSDLKKVTEISISAKCLFEFIFSFYSIDVEKLKTKTNVLYGIW